ncbi:MAG: serine/threonine protein kinase [Gammaproteobacteria bacterium]|nr:serine/threonine protein kinase [Gammaproteobacteria bacterium]
MDAERWRMLSPLLDALLELEPHARSRSLAAMRAEDPRLAGELEALLALEDDAGTFLDTPLVAPLPGARPGSQVGPYRLERLLGEGGMGQVWLASRADGLYQRRVALKLLRPGLADPGLRLRFTREREILARLEHAHIARLLDAGISADNQPYLALDYVDGEPISDWCERREPEVRPLVQLFLQVCDAVSHAHANLIVHRDLKPSNILVTPLDEVRLLDFGIAKLLDSADLPDHTRTGARAFTLHYAAPEQIRGEPVSTLTDVYSLGVVLYELLAGTKPYAPRHKSDAQWEEAILHGDPMRPSQALQRRAEAEPGSAAALQRRARAVAGDLDNIVLKAMSKRYEQRYASVEAMAQDLQRHLDGKPVLARPQRMAYRAGKFLRRHRWPLSTAALVLAVMATALGLVAWQSRLALQDAERAQAMQNFVISLFQDAGEARGEAPLDVRQLLEAGVERGEAELERQPMARAALLGAIGRLRLGLGDRAEALELLTRQAGLLAAADNAPAGLRLESATDLGHALRLTRGAGQCVEHMQELQPLARRQERRLPRQAAGFHTQLGRCHRALGQREQAAAQFRRALALRRDRLPGSAGIAENMADLAGLEADAGRYEAALRGLEAAHDQLQGTVGDRNPLTIRVLREICALRARAGRLHGASQACAGAVSAAAGLLGPHHGTTREARNEYAALLERLAAPTGPAPAQEQDFESAPEADAALSPAEDPAAAARSAPGPASPS